MDRLLTMEESRKGPHSRDEEPLYWMGAAKHPHSWEPTFPPKQFQSVLLLRAISAVLKLGDISYFYYFFNVTLIF